MKSYSGNHCAVVTTIHAGDDVRYFAAALNSILNQKGIVGSPRVYLGCDGPLAKNQQQWLERNVSSIYKLVTSEQCVGHGVMLNRLIDSLEDERYVFRMDNDDINHEKRFIKQIKFLENNKEYALIGCQAWDINHNGERVAMRDFPLSHEDCIDYMTRMNPILHPTYCMRRGILYDKNIRYSPDYFPATEDWGFVVGLVENGYRIANIDERLFEWRIGDSFFERRQSFNRGICEFRASSKAIYITKGLFSYMYLFSMLRLLLRCSPPNFQKKIYRSKIRKIMSLKTT